MKTRVQASYVVSQQAKKLPSNLKLYKVCLEFEKAQPIESFYNEPRIAHAQAVRRAKQNPNAKVSVWENVGGRYEMLAAYEHNLHSLANALAREEAYTNRKMAEARDDVARGISQAARWLDALARPEVALKIRHHTKVAG